MNSQQGIWLPIGIGLSAGMLLTFMAMHFGLTPRAASMLGGGVSALIAASVVTKRRSASLTAAQIQRPPVGKTPQRDLMAPAHAKTRTSSETRSRESSWRYLGPYAHHIASQALSVWSAPRR